MSNADRFRAAWIARRLAQCTCGAQMKFPNIVPESMLAHAFMCDKAIVYRRVAQVATGGVHADDCLNRIITER